MPFLSESEGESEYLLTRIRVFTVDHATLSDHQGEREDQKMI